MSQLQLNMSDPHPSYYNTNGLTGAHLAEKKAAAKTQEVMVLELFKKYSPVNFIRDEICEKLPEACPTSIGRAMTNLMNAGLLEKLQNKRRGHIYGATQHAYKLVK